MSVTQPNATRGFILALLATIFLACNYVTAKYGLIDPLHPELGGFNPETLSVTWMGAATIYAFIWACVSRQGKMLVLRGRPLRWMIMLGVANAVCQFTMWQGLQRLDPSFAAFLGRFAPMLAIVMGVFILGDRLGAWEWVAVGAMILGGFWSSAGSYRIEWLGIALSLVSAFFSAMQWPLAKIGGKGVPGVAMNFYRVGVAAVAVTAWAVVSSTLDFSTAQPRHWIVTLLGSLIGPFLSYLLMFRSYDYWNISRSAIVWTIQPLIVMPMAYIVFGQVPTGAKLVGGLITIAGAFWLAWLHRR